MYATSTIRSNRIGLPKALTNDKAFAKRPQGYLEWRMHSSRKMCSIVWMVKKSIFSYHPHINPQRLLRGGQSLCLGSPVVFKKMWKPHLYTCNAFLDTSLVNMYIIHKEMLKRRGTAREAMNVWSSTLRWQRHKPQIGLGR
jgi:hypothetical protein